ncbi:SDR family oxidoreductase [Polynucleobacter sp. IMCC30063]|uniref:SDR family NAD(P)-dependent oxidoreductase n=1 Tax=Polynucleobacter sp. IMCC30063 TaxID=2907298 RepID=UPI001F30C286|nr:SDR family oxidoreductase [Polynucleobacter sp. IMCC30063]MCE7505299.1 SDR family oxidoreductase [Polynucleobacter sp. IMCC30063]
MDLQIEGRVALITGASKNLGRQIAIQLASEGARIIAVARDENALELLLSELPGPKNNHLILGIDLLEEGGVSQLISSLKNSNFSPDIVIHNLGGSLKVVDPFSEVEKWNIVWQYNIGVAIAINNFVIPRMVEKHFGRIIHISTLSTQSQQGYAPYVSAKYALEGYVKTVSQTVSQHNVVINAIAPGLLDIEDRYYGRMKRENLPKLNEYFSHYLPIKRMGSLEEIAILVTFMASQHSSFMPGSIIRIDGGGR